MESKANTIAMLRILIIASALVPIVLGIMAFGGALGMTPTMGWFLIGVGVFDVLVALIIFRKR